MKRSTMVGAVVGVLVFAGGFWFVTGRSQTPLGKTAARMECRGAGANRRSPEARGATRATRPSAGRPEGASRNAVEPTAGENLRVVPSDEADPAIVARYRHVFQYVGPIPEPKASAQPDPEAPVAKDPDVARYTFSERQRDMLAASNPEYKALIEENERYYEQQRALFEATGLTERERALPRETDDDR